MRLSGCLALLSLTLLAGCGGPTLSKVKGQFVDGGQPIKPDTNRSYNLVFTPMGEPGQGTNNEIGLVNSPEAEFELTGPDNRGIPVGKYRVKLQITDPTPTPRMLALQRRFGNDQSPIVIEVKQTEEPIVIDASSYKGK